MRRFGRLQSINVSGFIKERTGTSPMIEKKQSKGRHMRGSKAQAIVEFAIVLPILLVVLVGVLEVGRYMFLYSAATNASRNASRYASAVGRADNGLTKFNYCEGIKQTALNSAYLVDRSTIGVSIQYDDGQGNSIGVCDLWDSSQVDPDVAVGSGDRVEVTVTIQYSPMVSLVPLQPQTITSSSARTILGIINLP
jgi:Flp pilus assembly protein TadG